MRHRHFPLDYLICLQVILPYGFQTLKHSPTSSLTFKHFWSDTFWWWASVNFKKKLKKLKFFYFRKCIKDWQLYYISTKLRTGSSSGKGRTGSKISWERTILCWIIWRSESKKKYLPHTILGKRERRFKNVRIQDPASYRGWRKWTGKYRLKTNKVVDLNKLKNRGWH